MGCTNTKYLTAEDVCFLVDRQLVDAQRIKVEIFNDGSYYINTYGGGFFKIRGKLIPGEFEVFFQEERNRIIEHFLNTQNGKFRRYENSQFIAGHLRIFIRDNGLKFYKNVIDASPNNTDVKKHRLLSRDLCRLYEDRKNRTLYVTDRDYVYSEFYRCYIYV